MLVTVRVHGMLRAAMNTACDKIQMPEGATLGDLLDEIGIRRDAPALAIINGRTAKPDQSLCEGAEVSIFSRVSGG